MRTEHVVYPSHRWLFRRNDKHVSNGNKNLYGRNTVPHIKAVIAKYESSSLVKDTIVWTYLPIAPSHTSMLLKDTAQRLSSLPAPKVTKLWIHPLGRFTDTIANRVKVRDRSFTSLKIFYCSVRSIDHKDRLVKFF